MQIVKKINTAHTNGQTGPGEMMRALQASARAGGRTARGAALMCIARWFTPVLFCVVRRASWVVARARARPPRARAARPPAPVRRHGWASETCRACWRASVRRARVCGVTCVCVCVFCLMVFFRGYDTRGSRGLRRGPGRARTRPWRRARQ